MACTLVHVERRSELRERRRAQGYTQESLGLALYVSTSTVRSWERGDRAPHLRNRPGLARLLAVTVAEVNRWFSGIEPADGVMPAWLGTLAALEAGASEIWTYEPVVVPGLAQTAAYARAVQLGEPGPPDVAEVDLAVQARLARQAVLTRAPDPLRLHMLIDESVLHRPVGGASVMADQLRHLLKLIDTTNVTVQLFPLDAGIYSAAFGHFLVLSSPRAERPYMAHVLDRGGGHYLDRREDVERHVRLFQHLLTRALSEADTATAIESVIRSRYP
jgi:transcriptional regulator with XRE-family HTH domain